MLSADSPISSSSDDALGRKTFAEALAKALFQFSAEDSFVVGVHGKWGSGKSSILNLLVEQIDRGNEATAGNEKLHIMRFNPWNFADQNQLVFQFLRQFGAHLRGDHKIKDIAALLSDYAETLAPPLDLLPFGNWLSSGVKVAHKLFGSTKDVTSLFEQIATKAKKLRHRTVVLIDDIDRLTAVETRQIFQLVKQTARFPYVIYILAFDREAVAASLKELGVDSGEEYLEKIVQVSFDIPPIPEAALTSFITTSIDKLVATYEPGHFDAVRFGNLFYAGLRNRLRSLRDVIRFINGLEFGFGLIGRELNSVDFIAIEALRIFYPQTFNVIRNNKAHFAGHVDALLELSGAKEYETRLNNLLTSNGAISDELQSLLIELFPKLSYAYGRTKYGHEFEIEWEKTHRVAAKRYFDTYFSLTLASWEVSVQEITSLIEMSDDQDAMEKIFVRWKQDGKLENGIATLRYRQGEIRIDNLRRVFAALLTSGEIANTQRSALASSNAPESWKMLWAIFGILDAIPTGDRVSVVQNVFSTSAALRTMVEIIMSVDEEKKKNLNKFAEFTDKAIDEIKSIVVRKIQEAAIDRATLLGHPALPTILDAWKQWGSAIEVNAFMLDAVKTDDGLIALVDSFIYQTYSISNRVGETRNYLRLTPLSECIELGELQQRLDRIVNTDLRDNQMGIVQLARRELNIFRQKDLTPAQFDNRRALLDALDVADHS
ncbi:MAG TPA: P-loop NTPase fold protein [Candidatus Angelobacter sp.]|nr:P-loop NTPase fold protein [Candidatus Angelobacter sp.]